MNVRNTEIQLQTHNPGKESSKNSFTEKINLSF